jgi:hypothetical protein
MYLYRNIEVGGKSGQPPKEAVQTLGRRSDGEPMANPQRRRPPANGEPSATPHDKVGKKLSTSTFMSSCT